MANSTLARRLVVLLICVAPALGLSVPSQNRKDAENGQQALQNLEEHWLHSEDNPDAIDKIIADDFIHVLPFGFINKLDQIAHAKQMQAAPPAIDKHFEDLRVRIYGEVGIVNGMVVTTVSDGSIKKTKILSASQRRACWIQEES